MKSGDRDGTRSRTLTQRMDRVERILPTLATKTDLERFATKEDLKKELESFATKEYLKKELERFATKDDLQDAVGQVRILFEAQTHEIRLLAEALHAHVGRHAALERRVDDHDTALGGLDLRVRQIDASARRRRR